MNELRLDDTFNSWGKLLFLHVWLVMVRLGQEGSEGAFVYKELIQHMWEDMDRRAKKLQAGGSSKKRKEGLRVMYAHFVEALLAYDEGALGSDIALAGALWRSLFEMDCKDAVYLELMVDYTRRQLAHVDLGDSSELLRTGLVKFLPLYESAEFDERQKAVLAEIVRRT